MQLYSTQFYGMTHQRPSFCSQHLTDRPMQRSAQGRLTQKVTVTGKDGIASGDGQMGRD